MIRATFTFTSDLVDFVQFEVDLKTKGHQSLKTVWLTYKAQSGQDTPLAIASTARIDAYPIWAEQPAALVQRALHLWRMTHFSSIPPVLAHGVVKWMGVAIRHHQSDNDSGLDLMALSFIRHPELDGKCAVNQTAPGRAYWPMDVDNFDAVPFAVATSVLEQVQHTQFNLHRLPSPLRLPTHTDNEGGGYVLREDIPYYALPALDRFNRQYPQNESPIEAEHIVSARRWNNFLMAL